MAYDISWEPNGVHKRLRGVVSAEEFLETVEAVQRDPRFLGIRYVINDFTDVTGHGLTGDVLGELAALKYGAHATNPRCRVLFVTQDEKLIRLIRRHLVDGPMVGYTVLIARTLEEARRRLETQPATFRLPLGRGGERRLSSED
jgi:hypothetical protein